MSDAVWFAALGGSAIGLLLGALIIEIRDRIIDRRSKSLDNRKLIS